MRILNPYRLSAKPVLSSGSVVKGKRYPPIRTLMASWHRHRHGALEQKIGAREQANEGRVAYIITGD